MSSTDRLNTLRGLVKEIDALCEKTNAEQKEFERKVTESREKAWMMFCTQIAPYWELVKEIKPKFTEETIYAKTGVDDYEIAFTEDRVRIDYNNHRCTFTRLTNCTMDFMEIHEVIKIYFSRSKKIKDYDETSIFVRLPKEFDFELFEKSFVQAVEEEMRMRSELANSNYEQAKAKYEAERSA